MQDPLQRERHTVSAVCKKSVDSEQVADEPQARPTSTEATEATTPQCIDGWFDNPGLVRETNASAETSRGDDSYSEAEEGYDVVRLRVSGSSSPSIEAVDQDYSLISSNERLQLRQSGHSDIPWQVPDRVFSWDESGWHEEEEHQGYEFVERDARQ